MNNENEKPSIHELLQKLREIHTEDVAKRTAEDMLCGEQKPTLNQAAWVVAHLYDNMVDHGSYRYIIYDRMGYDMDSYGVMLEAGLMEVHNHLLSPVRQEMCCWTENADGMWTTDCEHCFEFNDDGADNNHFKFCPYCGGELKAKPYVPEEEDE